MPVSASDIRIDSFPSGHLVTRGLENAGERTIVFANPYIAQLLGIADAQPLAGKLLVELFTRASAIMIESYLIPMLLKDEKVQEMQLELQLPSGIKLPVVVNAQRSTTDRDLVYWSLFSASQRDKLYQELILARRAIEEKARELEQLASTDSLTGLLNRRELIRRTEFLLSYIRRSGKPLSLAILDIDHFKKINDEFGHETGDEVIKGVARVLKAAARESDIVGRIGGEEFVIVMPDTDQQSAISVVQRLQDKLRATVLIEQPVTASLGIAVQFVDGSSFRELLAAADKALYKAKHAGRNRFMLASPPRQKLPYETGLSSGSLLPDQ
jgi:diguanylate cyclase (GGDEF)-like protein